MEFIKDNETLRGYLGNVIAEAPGESSYYAKVLPWLKAAEQWLINEIIGTYLPTLVAREQSDAFKAAASATAQYAMYLTVPSLDLVLTANGYAVASNENIAPASKERVDRLRESLLAGRDQSIDQLLLQLLQSKEWRQTEQGRWFTGSVFMRPGDVSPDCSYSNFINFRDKVEPHEQSLVGKTLSQELWSALLGRRHSNPLPADTQLVQGVKSMLSALAQGKEITNRWEAVSRIVEYIKAHAADFPEWEKSPTAQLYQPNATFFENKKNSTGYWW